MHETARKTAGKTIAFFDKDCYNAILGSRFTRGTGNLQKFRCSAMSTPTKTSKPTQKGPLVVQALLLVILLACLCRIVLLKAEQTPLTDEKITVSAVTPQPVGPTIAMR